MYARTIVARLIPGTADETSQIFRDEVVPRAQEQPGFVSISLFLDREGNRAQATSVWDSSAARAATAVGTRYQSALIALMATSVIDLEATDWEVVDLS